MLGGGSSRARVGLAIEYLFNLAYSCRQRWPEHARHRQLPRHVRVALQVQQGRRDQQRRFKAAPNYVSPETVRTRLYSTVWQRPCIAIGAYHAVKFGCQVIFDNEESGRVYLQPREVDPTFLKRSDMLKMHIKQHML